MDLTVKDIQDPDFVDVRVQGWAELAPEQREQCIAKLRGLVHERAETAHSIAVDATELGNRLMRIGRPLSLSQTPPPDPEADEREKLEGERESCKALIDADGRPCYPIGLAPHIYQNPGPYKPIISYWENGPSQWSRPIAAQLKRWTEFRLFQQRNRDYFVQRATFPRLQLELLERRRRHGLNGDVRLLEDRDQQTPLDHWLEYQDYELRRWDIYEKDREKAQSGLIIRRKTLAEAGLSAFEGTEDLDFGTFYGLSAEYSTEIDEARNEERSAERNLKLAEIRLRTATSDDLGERVERLAWIQRFEDQLETAQMLLDAVPIYREDDWRPGGLYYVQDGQTERERDERTRKARSARYTEERKAKEGLRLAREGLAAAQLDDFGLAVDRATLIKMLHEEVQSAQRQYEEKEKSVKRIELKGGVLGALGSIVSLRLKMDRHRVLLEWIEQQRLEMEHAKPLWEQEGIQS
ncbi:MAG: hypothetical protein M1826_006826 [Phylliscum demangeonii]|nr:MAG: hypothetical protein M1826_006826 [Phylliscum demangeonii]